MIRRITKFKKVFIKGNVSLFIDYKIKQDNQILYNDRISKYFDVKLDKDSVSIEPKNKKSNKNVKIYINYNQLHILSLGNGVKAVSNVFCFPNIMTLNNKSTLDAKRSVAKSNITIELKEKSKMNVNYVNLYNSVLNLTVKNSYIHFNKGYLPNIVLEFISHSKIDMRNILINNCNVKEILNSEVSMHIDKTITGIPNIIRHNIKSTFNVSSTNPNVYKVAMTFPSNTYNVSKVNKKIYKKPLYEDYYGLTFGKEAKEILFKEIYKTKKEVNKKNSISKVEDNKKDEDKFDEIIKEQDERLKKQNHILKNNFINADSRDEYLYSLNKKREEEHIISLLKISNVFEKINDTNRLKILTFVQNLDEDTLNILDTQQVQNYNKIIIIYDLKKELFKYSNNSDILFHKVSELNTNVSF